MRRLEAVITVAAMDEAGKNAWCRERGVGTRYLGNYLGWRRLIERHNGEISSADFLRAALGVDGAQYAMGT